MWRLGCSSRHWSIQRIQWLVFRLFDLFGQPGEDIGGAANDRHRDGEILADFGGVDIDVDDLDAGVEGAEPTHRAVIEAHADADDQVGLIGGLVRVEHPVHTEPAVAEGVRFGESADAEEGGDDGDAGSLREFEECGLGIAPDDSMPGDDDGAFRLVDEFGCAADHAGMALDGGLVAAKVDLFGPVVLGGFLEDILRDIDEDGSRTAGCGRCGPPRGWRVGSLPGA